MKKRLFNAFIVLMFIGSIFTFFSCHEDDDDNEYDSDLPAEVGINPFVGKTLSQIDENGVRTWRFFEDDDVIVDDGTSIPLLYEYSYNTTKSYLYLEQELDYLSNPGYSASDFNLYKHGLDSVKIFEYAISESNLTLSEKFNPSDLYSVNSVSPEGDVSIHYSCISWSGIVNDSVTRFSSIISYMPKNKTFSAGVYTVDSVTGFVTRIDDAYIYGAYSVASDNSSLTLSFTSKPQNVGLDSVSSVEFPLSPIK